MKDLLAVLWNRLFWKSPPDCPTCGLPLIEKTKEKRIRHVDREMWGPFTGIGILAGLILAVTVSFILDYYNTPKYHVYAILPSFFLTFFFVSGAFSAFGFWIGSSFRIIEPTYFPCPSLECEEKERRILSAPVSHYNTIGNMTQEQITKMYAVSSSYYMNDRNRLYKPR